MEFLDSKIVLAKSLIGTCNSRSGNTPVSHVSRRVLLAGVPPHLPVVEENIDTAKLDGLKKNIHSM